MKFWHQPCVCLLIIFPECRHSRYFTPLHSLTNKTMVQLNLDHCVNSHLIPDFIRRKHSQPIKIKRRQQCEARGHLQLFVPVCVCKCMCTHTGFLSVQRGFHFPSWEVDKHAASSMTAADVQTRYSHRERIISQTTPLKLSTLCWILSVQAPPP